jgi:hypothetical protein
MLLLKSDVTTYASPSKHLLHISVIVMTFYIPLIHSVAFHIAQSQIIYIIAISIGLHMLLSFGNITTYIKKFRIIIFILWA